MGRVETILTAMAAITSYRANLSDAAAEVLRHLSRDLDRAAYRQKEGALVVPERQSAE
jgi:biopolymer transport protein ExbB